MARNAERLRNILKKLELRFFLQEPGLGAIVFIFDCNGPRERPISIMLHGINEPEAIRMLREQADSIERASHGLILPPTAPLIVKPS